MNLGTKIVFFFISASCLHWKSDVSLTVLEGCTVFHSLLKEANYFN